MELFLLKLQGSVSEGYDKTVKFLNFLVADKELSKDGIGIHFLFIKSYLHICFSVNPNKQDLLASLIRSFFMDTDIIKFNIDDANLSTAKINLKKKYTVPVKTQYQISSDVTSTIINTFFRTPDPLCGMTIWLRSIDQSTIGKYKSYKKDQMLIAHFPNDLEKVRSKYVYADISIYASQYLDQIISDVKTSLQAFGIKNQNFYEIRNSKTVSLTDLLLNNQITGNKLYTTAELASILHFPDSDTVDFSRIILNRRKLIAPPKSIIDIEENGHDVAFFAQTKFKGITHSIGLKTNDRMRHLYIIGKSGSGKSKLMQNIMISDFNNKRPMIFIDPHGETAKEVLSLIPKDRVEDVIYFDPTEANTHIGFNPIENTGGSAQSLVDGFVSIFQKALKSDWNDNLEYLLRLTLLALINTDNSTFPNVVKMLTDKDFRRQVVDKLTDENIKTFWTTTFLSYQDKNSSEISKLINRISQLMTNKTVRMTLSQKKSGFNLEDILSNNKILIVNLSIGKLGEWTSSFMGSILITKIWQTMIAQSGQVRKNNLYLFIDEFQNFATESFVQIFSEARKYGLSVTVANQYINQIPESIRKALFGNIGSIISFRLGAEDAQIMAREFAPVFNEHDFTNLNQKELYLKISVDGITSPPFSAESLDLIIPELNFSNHIIYKSKSLGKPTSQVEKEIEGQTIPSSQEFSSFAPPII